MRTSRPCWTRWRGVGTRQLWCTVADGSAAARWSTRRTGPPGYWIATALVRGDVVTLLGGNAPEMITGRYAANLLGCGVTEPYGGLSAEAKAKIVADVDTGILLVDPSFRDNAAQVLERCSPGAVLSFGDGIGPDLLALAAAESAEPVVCGARPDDVQQIRHTGGTTGHPEGICYTFDHHRRVLNLGIAGEEPDYQRRQLVCTTIAHAAGGFADRSLARGGLVVLQDEFDPAEVLAAVERERITDMWLLPPLIYRLLDHPDSEDTDLSSLRNVVYGGCRANPTRMSEAVERFGPVFTQVYGQTEAGLISVLTPREHHDPELLGTAGRVAPTTELAICDEHGDRIAEGERGELWARTGMEMDGYWKQPELTARTVQDGWVDTGDVGYLDVEGYLHVVDRVKDVIVVVGGHVCTSEVENVLMEHPGVRGAAVFGTPDPNGAERVHAAVVTAEDVADEDLTSLVEERKGAMYVPSDVTFVRQLPLTDVGKPDKKALRAQLVG
ncbi:fatty-acyl-CoA synthase [Saccharopolyspora lacisalsi]|uniref:Fatty-acyl-CoA synthase n=1 Tax=Halosaccharopolyspora lacisalsi TaxID=1000566 RepID=A0A839E2K3_9PSEU|nr:AMP-binding protein [Halosaccharopolyspora lacisalsi]MBA8826796.1 fatty-acyl-CoA synthase [Halosaccharopolyspora lacisalsi]